MDSSLESNTAFYAFSGKTWLEIKTFIQQVAMRTALSSSIVYRFRYFCWSDLPFDCQAVFQSTKNVWGFNIRKRFSSIFAQVLLWILYTSFKQEKNKIKAILAFVEMFVYKDLFLSVCLYTHVLVYACACMCFYGCIYPNMCVDVCMCVHASMSPHAFRCQKRKGIRAPRSWSCRQFVSHLIWC